MLRPQHRQRARTFQRAGAWIVTLFVGLTLPPMTAPLEAAAASRVACGACEQADRFVRLQDAPSKTHQNSVSDLAHPFPLSSEDWTAVLQQIRIRKRDRGWFFIAAPPDAASPAFTREEIDYLSTTLPRAFAQAQPGEWVTFGLSRTTTPDVAALTEFTTGAWYVEGDSLHLVFANYREGVTMPGIRDLLREDPLHMIAGPRYEFAPGPHQLARPAEDGLRTFFFPDLPELVLVYRALVLEARGGNAPPAGSETFYPLPLPSTPPSIEDQLYRLKRLKEQGLITEEDYQSKKRQILERF